MAAQFYVATTPIPDGHFEMHAASTGNKVCCFKIGDTTNFVDRFKAYRSMNPDVSTKSFDLVYPITNSRIGVTLPHQYSRMESCQSFL